MTTKKLLPCKRCGSDPVLVKVTAAWWFVKCPPCDGDPVTTSCFEKSEAIRRWNRGEQKEAPL